MRHAPTPESLSTECSRPAGVWPWVRSPHAVTVDRDVAVSRPRVVRARRRRRTVVGRHEPASGVVREVRRDPAGGLGVELTRRAYVRVVTAPPVVTETTFPVSSYAYATVRRSLP